MSALSVGAGGGLGAILGQLLSAPRRAAWSAVGLPESGNEALGQLFGMDQESPLTKALGMGAEMAFDPMSLAGLGLGKLIPMGLGAAAKASGRLAEAEGLASQIPKLQEAAGAFSGAADAQRAASFGGAEKFTEYLQKALGTKLEPNMRPEIFSQLPNVEDLAVLNRSAGMPGAARTSNLVGQGMKNFPKYTDELASELGSQGLAQHGPKGLEVIPKVRYGPKDYKAVGNDFTNVRGGKAFLDEEAAPILRSLPQSHDIGSFPTMPYEDMLRKAATRTGGALEGAQGQLSGFLNPENAGLLEQVMLQGADSPLGRAILMGLAGGGAGGLGYLAARGQQ